MIPLNKQEQTEAVELSKILVTVAKQCDPLVAYAALEIVSQETLQGILDQVPMSDERARELILAINDWAANNHTCAECIAEEKASAN